MARLLSPSQERAKESMGSALDAVASQPTVFFRCHCAVKAVTDVLGVDMLEYSMPQTQEELDEFDWDNLTPGRKETYPTVSQPSEEDFEKVRSAHQFVKKEKDTQARAMGLPKSGVQSYCTYKQRWKQWQDLCAVYRHINQAVDLSLVQTIMAGRLKLCNSLNAIDDVVQEDLVKYINKCKREAKKEEEKKAIQDVLIVIIEEETEAALMADAAAEQQELVRKAKEDIKKPRLTDFDGATRQEKTKKKAEEILKKGEEEKQTAEALRIAKTGPVGED